MFKKHVFIKKYLHVNLWYMHCGNFTDIKRIIETYI